MSKKILVLGSSGMLGHVVFYYLKENTDFIVSGLDYRNKLTDDNFICDVRDEEKLKYILYQLKPDILINCIGALIKESKSNPANAIFLNAYFPHALKKICDNLNTKLIHISTDCVFSGKKGNYKENDFRDADDIYGRSKALGEIINDKDVTLRTSIIGPELKRDGEGLFHWLFSQKGEIKGYTKALWSGVTTLELAKSVLKVINYNLNGLMHVTNGKPISKFDLLSVIKEVWEKKDIIIKPYSEYVLDKTLVITEKFNFEIPDYRKMLTEMKDWMNSHSELYSYYL